MRPALQRTLAATAAALIGMAVAAPASPASAAAATAGLHFPDLAVAAGAPGKVAAAMAWIQAPDAAQRIGRLTVSVDTAGVAGVATVESFDSLEDTDDRTCDQAGSTITCVLTGPFPGDIGTMLPLLALEVTAAKTATTGGSGELAFSARADDGPVTRHRSTVRIGEGVDLAAVDTKPLALAPGAAGSADLRVANKGDKPVDGVVLAMLGWDERLLEGKGFANCRYGLLIVCRFDDRLAPGATYGFATPLRLRMPADAAAGSSTTAFGAWYTPADFAELLDMIPEELAEEALGRPGAGPAVQLTAVAAKAVQVDTDPENNVLISEVVVTGGQKPDMAAIGATVSGAPGDTVRARVGFVNNGPGTLYHSAFDNTDPATHVTVPPGLEAVEVDERCVPFSSFDPDDFVGVPYYVCAAGDGSTAAKKSLLFDFTFEVRATGDDSPGGVRINDEVWAAGAVLDRNSRNDSAAILVTTSGGGGGLPVTGANGMLLGGLGVVLLAGGVAGVLTARRRRVHFTV